MSNEELFTKWAHENIQPDQWANMTIQARAYVRLAFIAGLDHHQSQKCANTQG